MIFKIVFLFHIGALAGTPPNSVEYLVVGGGGGGGRYGGGGAGGFLSNLGGTQYALGNIMADVSLMVQIGNGGSGADIGNNGGDSVFGVITALGGGGGSGYGGGGAQGPAGKNGGSGGGGGFGTSSVGGSGVAGQGRNGGRNGGGGGGAGQVGADDMGGKGGDGLQSNITGTATYYAGGGSGFPNGGSCGPIYTGGLGGGGDGKCPFNGGSGVANTGGGGGGGGGAGGSGLVIIRYPAIYDEAKNVTGNPVVTVAMISGAAYRIYTFNTVGTWSISFGIFKKIFKRSNIHKDFLFLDL